MEKQLNYNLMLTLKEVALRRIGMAMCNEPRFLKMIATERHAEHAYGKRPDYSEILHNLSNIGLPHSLKRQMIPILQALVSEILRWKIFHETFLNEDIHLCVLKKLCWTTAGTINCQKTAEVLVRCSPDELLNAENRFKLACLYCLENYIPELWRELPEEIQMIFYDGDLSQIEEPHLQLFLPDFIEREAPELYGYNFPMNFYNFFVNNSFERAVFLGNTTIVDYCFSKLTKEEKEASLVQAARNVIRKRYFSKCMCPSYCLSSRSLSVSCHLLSLMTADEQIAILKELPCEVISCYLDWPYQDLFLYIADVIWTFLPESKYGALVRTLQDGFVTPDYYFPHLFQGFFLGSPVNFRKRFVDHECERAQFFNTFVCNGDAETIRIVLRNLDTADRVRFVFSDGGLELIYQQKQMWDMMKVFLQEATLTNEEKRSLKEAVTEYVRKQGRIQGINQEFGRFFEFLAKDDAVLRAREA